MSFLIQGKECAEKKQKWFLDKKKKKYVRDALVIFVVRFVISYYHQLIVLKNLLYLLQSNEINCLEEEKESFKNLIKKS